MVVAHPSAPEPSISFVELASTTDTSEDLPLGPLVPADAQGWSPLAVGCATLGYGIYAPPPTTKEDLEMPLRMVRLALRYGVTVFDTSPHYHPSEVVLGNCFRALKDEYPRESYKVITKTGRYAGDGFDYSPENIETSVRRSLRRLGCGYLDVVYLHDVEFVATPQACLQKIYKPLDFLSDPKLQAEAGLLDSQAGEILGEGDEKIVAAFQVLMKLRDEGLVKDIGISGYPLPVLLRLSRLLASNPLTTPGITSLLSYSHSNLANTSFSSYLPLFLQTSPNLRILTASPLSMGLLSPSGPPNWHPARTGSPQLMKSTAEAIDLAKEKWGKEGGVVDLALGFGVRNLEVEKGGRKVPVVVGWKNVGEVHEGVRVWREVNGLGGEGGKEAKKGREETEVKFRKVFERDGVQDMSWPSGPWTK
ncbi:NADP-dependent oxidoreductase domain-containing protein [Mrakia frigida]|uniref:D-arabinose 1-dehydrogenase (NAD(P)(+)) ARA2 n=1 Tax=Mrakia frigida TaxID=29902 RepID=UPI003FCC1503